MNLTELDKKILFELDQDGRISLSDIARNIGTTPQVVKYHYQALLDNKIIKHFWAFIDYDRAGYSFFWGYWLKFSGLTQEAERAMYTDFQDNKFIPIIMRCDGYADALLGIIGRDIFHHNEVLQDVLAKYGQYITTSEMVVGLGFIKFPRTYLVNKKNAPNQLTVSGGTTSKEKLSELDRKILSLLQIDGRMEFTKMGNILQKTPAVIQKHYNGLVKNKVITKTTYTLNYDKIDLKLFRVLFKIIQSNKNEIKDLYIFCEEHPNIINYVKTMGNWQLILDIEIKNNDELRDLLREMKYRFRNIIFQIESNCVYKIDKFTQMVIEYPELIKTTKNK